MYHDAPEVTPSTDPQEFYQLPEPYHQRSEPYDQPGKHVPITRQDEKDEGGAPPPQTIARSRSGRKGVWAYGVIIFLVAAVIGLAVATGLGMKRAAAAELRASTAEERALTAEERASTAEERASTAEERASAAEDQLSSHDVPETATNNSTMSAAPELSSYVSLGAIDKGCSSSANTVNGTIQITPVGKTSYKILCNNNGLNKALLALLVSDFDQCMYACTRYTIDMPSLFPDDAEQRNKKCAGVSFIPKWTGWNEVRGAKARGNCYLKPGPMDDEKSYETSLSTHSAYVI